MGEQKTIKEIQKGNCIINFVEQTRSAGGQKYIDDLHQLIAELLLEEYKEKNALG